MGCGILLNNEVTQLFYCIFTHLQWNTYIWRVLILLHFLIPILIFPPYSWNSSSNEVSFPFSNLLLVHDPWSWNRFTCMSMDERIFAGVLVYCHWFPEPLLITDSPVWMGGSLNLLPLHKLSNMTYKRCITTAVLCQMSINIFIMQMFQG